MLPAWLNFSDRTLSGKPGPSDTAAFSDKTLPLKICATDGGDEVCILFDLSVQGVSREKQILMIAGPLGTAGALSITWYKKRGLILKPWNRKKYDKGTIKVLIRQSFTYQIATHKEEIESVKAFKGKKCRPSSLNLNASIAEAV